MKLNALQIIDIPLADFLPAMFAVSLYRVGVEYGFDGLGAGWAAALGGSALAAGARWLKKRGRSAPTRG